MDQINKMTAGDLYKQTEKELAAAREDKDMKKTAIIPDYKGVQDNNRDMEDLLRKFKEANTDDEFEVE